MRDFLERGKELLKASKEVDAVLHDFYEENRSVIDRLQELKKAAKKVETDISEYKDQINWCICRDCRSSVVFWDVDDGWKEASEEEILVLKGLGVPCHRVVCSFC